MKIRVSQNAKGATFLHVAAESLQAAYNDALVSARRMHRFAFVGYTPEQNAPGEYCFQLMVPSRPS